MANCKIMHNEIFFLDLLQIKTHNSESRGQEEASTTE